MEKNRHSVGSKRIPSAKSNLEREAWRNGVYVCGVDEVGRGCLAGPVVTCAVILYPKKVFSLLKDSKILTKDQRVRAAKWIKCNSWYAYGIVSHYEIDRYNIYQATILAMKRSIMHVFSQVDQCPKKILVDAMPLTFSSPIFQGVEIESFPFGEMKSISIAAASILAKVKRDELMGVYNKIFPGYVLAGHKGYGTRVHYRSIHEFGLSIIHRKSFLTKIESYEREEFYEKQISLLCGSD